MEASIQLNKMRFLRMLFLLSTFLFLICACSDTTRPENFEPDLVDESNSLSLNESAAGSHNDESAVVSDEPDKLLRPRIGIYAGKGSWDINILAAERFFEHYGVKYKLFDEQDALDGSINQDFDLIWFPGGFAAEYKNLIPNHDNIIMFVEQGGIFVGSCAGAYYASSILRWLGTDNPYPLELFKGKAVGPLAGEIGWGEIAKLSLEPGHPVNNNFDSALDMYYFDGPYFEADDPSSIQILARYTINNEPAVIAGRYGAGKFLLLGPHPELGGYTPESPDFNLDGGEGAQWPWLYAALIWISNW
jgi:glutamine amidotransferase-like uncharacterized protein